MLVSSIKIEVKSRKIFLPSKLIPVALSKRATFRYQFQKAINNQKIQNTYTKISTLYVSEFTLRRMIEKYSEQAVYRPIDDMRYYFKYSQRAFVEPGYPPLFYSAVVDRKPSQNISAICAIGEGVAGFISQRLYHCRKLARPYRDGVDIVMTANNITYLVEAKGSVANNEINWINKELDNEYLEEVAKETLSSFGIDIRLVKGILVGVYLKDELNYNCYVTELEII